MRVRITATGFINGSIANLGDEMEVPDKSFSPKWMESLEPKPAAKPAKAAPAAPAAPPAEI